MATIAHMHYIHTLPHHATSASGSKTKRHVSCLIAFLNVYFDKESNNNDDTISSSITIGSCSLIVWGMTYCVPTKEKGSLEAPT